LKEIPLGLYLYPVLQAADIMLYKWVFFSNSNQLIQSTIEPF
jgi:tryptophanyl-tRNA synthetase